MKVAAIPDTGDDRTPANVMAIKEFKNNLMKRNGNVSARDAIDSGVRIPDIKMGTSHLSEDTEAEFNAAEMELNGNEAEEQDTHVQAPAFNNPMQALSSYLESQPSREDIKITGDFGKLSFKAVNVSINDFGVAFIVRKDAFQFEPNINTNLKVIYKDAEYDVVYAGGFFTFAKMPFTFVSFLRISE